MPIRTSVPSGGPAWIDLLTSDPEAAQNFYGELFGWTFDVSGAEYGGYTSVSKDGHVVAGFMPCQETGPQNVWTVYLAVTDVHAVAARVGSERGKVVTDPLEIPGVGTFAVFEDPTGARIGAWQAGGLMGYELESEPGAPAWLELHTHGYSGARTFYERVFDWQISVMSDTEQFRYARHEVDGVPLAGIMDASTYQPEPQPGQWSVYFHVSDVDAACEVVSQRGGTVEQEPKDTPFGRLAGVMDPQGARFKLLSR